MGMNAQRQSSLFAADQRTAPIGVTRSTRRSAGAPAIEASRVAVGVPLFAAFLHFVIVQVTASLAYRHGAAADSSAPFRSSYGNSPLGVIRDSAPLTGIVDRLVSPLRLWDGLWYQLVAEKGYGFHSANAAFWPLFPWSMRGLANLGGISTAFAGYLIANLSFVVALVLFHRFVQLDFDDRTAAASVWAIALFPTSFFFAAVYTESPFLMLLVGALLAARLRHWWLAGAIGVLAALTRSYGVFLVLPFAVLFFQQHGAYLRRWIPNALPVALPVLGPALFSWRLKVIDGNPWAWKDVQSQWNRYSAKPWETLRWAFSSSPRGRAIPSPHGHFDGAYWGWIRDLADNPNWHLIASNAWRRDVAESDTLELVCTLLFLGLAVIGLFKLPLYQSAYLVPGLIVPLFQPSSVHTLMSMPRFGLTLFPLFVVLGILLKGRRLAVPLALLSTAMLVLLTIQFSQWYWVS